MPRLGVAAIVVEAVDEKQHLPPRRFATFPESDGPGNSRNGWLLPVIGIHFFVGSRISGIKDLGNVGDAKRKIIEDIQYRRSAYVL